MAISVNWGTNVINVPKADLTLIQSSPTEIRELDLNSLRLTLKNLEDDSDGMPFSKTHNHNTEVTLGGINYARIIEILDPYTITFEDGQYAVNLTGANSNLGDKVNVNQVSVRANNSAGLISSPDIEYSSFNGGVTIDVVNGVSGTVFPSGTARQPVNSLVDAGIIASYRGLTKLYIIGDITFGATDSISGYTICGQSIDKTTVTIESGCNTSEVEFEFAKLTGVLNSSHTHIINCEINTLSGFNGHISNSIFLESTITLSGSGDCNFIECKSGVAGTGTCTIDMGGSGRNLSVRGWIGGLKLINLTGANNVSLDFVSGHANLDSTVTSGTVVIRGGGVRTTLNQGDGCTVVENVADNTEMKKYVNNKKVISKNGSVWELTIFDDDGTTPILTKELKDKDGNNVDDLTAGDLCMELANNV